VIIALNAVLAAFYYLRVVVHMYMYDPDTGAPMVVNTRLLSAALGISALATIVLGVLPNSLYEWALQAANPLLQ
jgi:NADH-quinone oxidoreductase subunit N